MYFLIQLQDYPAVENQVHENLHKMATEYLRTSKNEGDNVC